MVYKFETIHIKDFLSYLLWKKKTNISLYLVQNNEHDRSFKYVDCFYN